MNRSLDLAQRTEQRLALMPKMLQSIEVLQMATVDLLHRIDEELARNELLEVAAAGDDLPAEAGAGAGGRDDAEAWDARDWEPRRAAAGDEDPKLAMLAQLPDRGGDGLIGAVREQLAWKGCSADLSRRVLLLAECLDERGLLAADEAELAALVGAEHVAEALEVLRELEPRGLGARDPVTAMLAQIDPRDPDREDIRRLLCDHLEDLARNRIPRVARALNRTTAEIVQLVERIRRLQPNPAGELRGGAAEPMRPELRVTLEDGEIHVHQDDRVLPALSINDDYARMAADRATDVEVRSYLRDKLRAARDLITAVEQRQQTLARVCAAVMAHQRRFLEAGRAAIQPLTMAEVADILELHPSTVSRAIAGKSVQTDHGVFPLRDFFDGGVDLGADSGRQPRSRAGVKERLAELVRAEEPAAPLSDEDLQRQLAAEGVKLARRTLTKYRRELGIPSSWQRRAYGEST